MEEILLALVCQEFELEEDFILSKCRNHHLQNAISMCTYILVSHYGKTIIEVHNFYVSKGYKKTRATLYRNMKRAHHNIRQYSSFRELKSSLIEGVEIALVQGLIVPTDEDIHAMKGRIVSKMMTLRDHTYLTKMESQVDSYIKAEFINKRQYEKNPKKETWLT
jgi:hypothetical protein